MVSASLALPIVPRCERPSAEMSSFWGAQPGGLAQGPDEKYGLVGLMAGFARRNSALVSVSVVNVTLLAESSRRVGTAWPAAASKEECGGGKAERKIRVRLRNDP